jgi:hypothetical protein
VPPACKAGAVPVGLKINGKIYTFYYNTYDVVNVFGSSIKTGKKKRACLLQGKLF